MRGGSKWGFMMLKTLKNKTLLHYFSIDITNDSDENLSPIFFSYRELSAKNKSFECFELRVLTNSCD